MEIKPVILVLADISGYTRFIRFHRSSLIHAEKIITDLLESVIAASDQPLVLHELEGDAVSFYAVEETETADAGAVFAQVEQFFEAFRRREAELISECGLCKCEACERVGQLRIKVVLHRGEAVFTSLRQFTKVAGEDVILAHRLLKNSVPSSEYILMTEPFYAACPPAQARPLERRTEHAEGLGDVPVYVLDLDTGAPVEMVRRPLWNRLATFGRMEGYLVKRLFGRPDPAYRSLQGL